MIYMNKDELYDASDYSIKYKTHQNLELFILKTCSSFTWNRFVRFGEFRRANELNYCVFVNLIIDKSLLIWPHDLETCIESPTGIELFWIL